MRLYRDLIALRKRHPSLNNCRKDLTEIRFDEQAKVLVMKRTDPDGERSLLVLNFSAQFQSIPVGVDVREWRQVLSTAADKYSVTPKPSIETAASSSTDVQLAGFEAAIYIR